MNLLRPTVLLSVMVFEMNAQMNVSAVAQKLTLVKCQAISGEAVSTCGLSLESELCLFRIAPTLYAPRVGPRSWNLFQVLAVQACWIEYDYLTKKGLILWQTLLTPQSAQVRLRHL